MKGKVSRAHKSHKVDLKTSSLSLLKATFLWGHFIFFVCLFIILFWRYFKGVKTNVIMSKQHFILCKAFSYPPSCLRLPRIW